MTSTGEIGFGPKHPLFQVDPMRLAQRGARTLLASGLLCIMAGCSDPAAPGSPAVITMVGDYGFLVERDDQFHVVGGPGARTVLPAGVAGLMPDVSHDGTRVAFVYPVQVGVSGFRGQIATIGIDGTGLTIHTAHNESGLWPRWSTDGAYLAYAMSTADNTYFDDLVIRRTSGGAGVRHVLDAPWDAVHGIAWSPDGQEIAFERSDGGIWVVGVDGAGLRQLTTGKDGNPDWSPDGSRVAFERIADGSRKVCIITLASPMEICIAISGWASDPRWSPDGQWLAVIGDDGGLYTVGPYGTGVTERIPGRWMGGTHYDWVKLR